MASATGEASAAIRLPSGKTRGSRARGREFSRGPTEDGSKNKICEISVFSGKMCGRRGRAIVFYSVFVEDVKLRRKQVYDSFLSFFNVFRQMRVICSRLRAAGTRLP